MRATTFIFTSTIISFLITITSLCSKTGNFADRSLQERNGIPKERIFIKLRQLPPNQHVPKTEFEKPTNAAIEAEKAGRKFINNLRIFVSDGSFDFEGFETQITEYRNDLADLVFRLENNPHYDERTRNKVEYLKKIFGVIVSATENMKRYKESRKPGHNLVYAAIELEVRAMLLYDSNGGIDKMIRRYQGERKNLSEKLALLFIESTRAGISFAQGRSFRLHISRALKLIDGLGK